MSPRRSKSGSRSANRARGTRGSGNAGRGSSHPRSLSASRHSASNSASNRRSNTRRAKRGRRAGSSASYAVKLLKEDHRAVAEALEQFESGERGEKQAIARRICRMLTVHSQIEEELLYPAARDALDSEDAHLVAEARVEHASLKDLIRQIEDREQLDEQYEAKVCVLGEYVKHHVSEEETELFPRLEDSSLDLQALGERLEERKSELMGEPRSGERPETMSGLSESRMDEDGQRAGKRSPPPGMASGTASSRSHRSAGLHARRR